MATKQRIRNAVDDFCKALKKEENTIPWKVAQERFGNATLKKARRRACVVMEPWEVRPGWGFKTPIRIKLTRLGAMRTRIK